ncbi:hypothetical protein PGTUg99_018884 [Puccinia graminis f. sp. tritici]|nr:hypothetical protein PGTUg99_022874 [Puccinia graminis f. sp. tritici]KAA1126776.1 hypothetical protein PGTUg99_018884 [Puccinia graminis f. sp. tritici]
MEGLPNKVKSEGSQAGSSSNVKSAHELLAEAEKNLKKFDKGLGEVSEQVNTNRKKVHFRAAEAHLHSKSLDEQDTYK